jgi:hypothetical protein
MSHPASVPLFLSIWLLASTATSGLASIGGEETCSSADGRYLLELLLDNKLVDRETSKTIGYQQIEKVLLEKKVSVCSGSDATRTYQIEFERYLLKVRIQQAEPSEHYLYCERYLDSSPAAACGDNRFDKVLAHEVLVPQYTTISSASSRAGEAVSLDPNRTRWNHNGSVVVLSRSKDRAEFVYERPRKGMTNVGARPGSRLFTGRLSGSQFDGTAFFYSRSCGQVPYSVSGTLSHDQRSVVLHGQAPRLGKSCSVTGTKTDTLEFSLLP